MGWLTRSPIIAALLCVCAAAVLLGWHYTMATPVVQRTTVVVPGMTADAGPLTIALISDIHVAGPDMPPARLAAIVRQINGLEPDIVMIAGDFVSDKRTATHIYGPQEVIAPLADLRAPLGVVAAPGNHDHWYDMPGLSARLEKAGIILLANDALQIGPLVIGGLDDDYTGRADLPGTMEKMASLDGGRIVLTHSPDPFPDMPQGFALMLAGHTHCGQIRYPWSGAPATLSDYGERYACGRVDERGNTIVTGAGLGTSLIWLRLFSYPEIWLIEMLPEGGN